MIDFSAVRSKEMTLTELVDGLTVEDLRSLTNEMVDTIVGIIGECSDADVVFVPSDPEAHDPYAENEADVDLAWTLGHLVVHATASNEESAALAAESARGVPYHGRSRAEVPWQSVTSIEQCFGRLEESRRMCLASLDMWPDKPDLANFYQRTAESPKVNAVTRYVFGLMHADSHLPQMADVVRQAKA
jgi:hypothetical protein